MSSNTKEKPGLFARVMVLDAMDRVLVLKNTKRGRWELPGGKVDAGESHQQAACRELYEETCLQLKPEQLREEGKNFLQTESGFWLGVFFSARPAEWDLARLAEPDKHSNMLWVDLEELSDLPQIPSVTLVPYQQYLKK